MVTISKNKQPQTVKETKGKLLQIIKLPLNGDKSRIVTAKEGFVFMSFHFFLRYITKIA